MQRKKANWASDTRPSVPAPLRRKAHVSLGGGWVFTDGGIATDINEAEVERFANAPISPHNSGGS